jgi:hypothetical protein
MNLTVEIPDDLVGQLNAAGGDLSRRALEALALQEYKSGHLTEDELQRLVGFGSRYQLDGFLKAQHLRFLALCPEVTAGQRRFGNTENEREQHNVPPERLRRLAGRFRSGCRRFV